MPRFGLALFASSIVFGQTFEVASIRPANPSRGIDIIVSRGGRLTATNCTLELLIQQAYNLDRYQVSGGPAWLTSDRYDIQATPPPGSPYLRVMLQNLLADRFHLQIHRETKEGTVYALVASARPKLQPTTNPDDRPALRNGFSGDHDSPTVRFYLEGTNISMTLLAAKLSGLVRRPVSDETGLTGSYDFKFDYAEGSDDFLASAIQSALGLKLESRKGAVETLIVDHAEKPSPN